MNTAPHGTPQGRCQVLEVSAQTLAQAWRRDQKNHRGVCVRGPASVLKLFRKAAGSRHLANAEGPRLWFLWVTLSGPPSQTGSQVCG